MKKLLIILWLLTGFVGCLCFRCEPALATMSSTIARETLFTGDGSTTEFVFTFPIIDTSDIEVWLRTTATGSQTQQTETTHYSISATNNNFVSGGTVTMVTAPASTQKLLLLRATPQTQSSDIGAYGVLVTLENALDKQQRQLIDLQEASNRSLKFPKTDATTISAIMDSSVDRASQLLGFNSSGEPTIIASGIAAGDATVTAYAETYLDDASEAAFKATTNLESGIDIQAWNAQLDDIAALAITNSNFIVGDGSNWVAESGATARTSLGLAIGTDVQAWDTQLDDIATLAVSNSNFIVGDGTNWVVESGATARASLGAAAGFVDRGDVATVDFNETSLSVTGTWTDLDLSSIVDSGATAVLLRVLGVDGSVDTTLSIRENGNSNAVNIGRIDTNVANIPITNDMIIPLSSDRIIEYLQDVDMDTAVIIVKGWWK